MSPHLTSSWSTPQAPQSVYLCTSSFPGIISTFVSTSILAYLVWASCTYFFQSIIALSEIHIIFYNDSRSVGERNRDNWSDPLHSFHLPSSLHDHLQNEIPHQFSVSRLRISFTRNFHRILLTILCLSFLLYDSARLTLLIFTFIYGESGLESSINKYSPVGHDIPKQMFFSTSATFGIASVSYSASFSMLGAERCFATYR